MPMLTVRLSDDEMVRLRELAVGSSVAALVRGWIAGADSKQLFDAARAAFSAATEHLSQDEVATATKAAVQAARSKPPLLAAPKDYCLTCGHDRQFYGHVYEPCGYPVTAERVCRCYDFDMGFE